MSKFASLVRWSPDSYVLAMFQNHSQCVSRMPSDQIQGRVWRYFNHSDWTKSDLRLKDVAKTLKWLRHQEPMIFVWGLIVMLVGPLYLKVVSTMASTTVASSLHLPWSGSSQIPHVIIFWGVRRSGHLPPCHSPIVVSPHSRRAPAAPVSPLQAALPTLL